VTEPAIKACARRIASLGQPSVSGGWTWRNLKMDCFLGRGGDVHSYRVPGRPGALMALSWRLSTPRRIASLGRPWRSYRAPGRPGTLMALLQRLSYRGYPSTRLAGRSVIYVIQVYMLYIPPPAPRSQPPEPRRACRWTPDAPCRWAHVIQLYMLYSYTCYTVIHVIQLYMLYSYTCYTVMYVIQ
jgi:hypothetical protein